MHNPKDSKMAILVHDMPLTKASKTNQLHLPKLVIGFCNNTLSINSESSEKVHFSTNFLDKSGNRNATKDSCKKLQYSQCCSKIELVFVCNVRFLYPMKQLLFSYSVGIFILSYHLYKWCYHIK